MSKPPRPAAFGPRAFSFLFWCFAVKSWASPKPTLAAARLCRNHAGCGPLNRRVPPVLVSCQISSFNIQCPSGNNSRSLRPRFARSLIDEFTSPLRSLPPPPKPFIPGRSACPSIHFWASPVGHYCRNSATLFSFLASASAPEQPSTCQRIPGPRCRSVIIIIEFYEWPGVSPPSTHKIEL